LLPVVVVFWPILQTATVTRKNVAGMLVACFAAALVLAVEQNFQFLLQIRCATVLFCGFECIHGWAVIVSECGNEL